MRPTRLPFLLALLCGVLLLAAGCGDDAKQKAKDIGRTVGEKAGATWNSIRDFSAEKKDQAVAFFSKSKDTLAEQYEKAKEREPGLER